MRFALLGDHPDGLALTQALTATGRHEVAVYSGPPPGADFLCARGLTFPTVGDLEEVLADPAVDAVVVAGSLTVRPEQLRRALQSERHVLCVHPADRTPDVGVQASLIQGDTGRVLLPLLPESLHPAIVRMRELVREAEGPVGTPRLLTLELGLTGSDDDDADAAERVSLPVWNVLRALGGEIAEVSAFAAGERLTKTEPTLLCGRFEPGGLFQVTLLPSEDVDRWRVTALGSSGRAELELPKSWTGPAHLRWSGPGGKGGDLRWDGWSPWAAFVETFEAAVTGKAGERRAAVPRGGLSWQDAVLCLELDDTARRSVAHRRASSPDFPEASEEVGFKGTMTLAGCALLLAVLGGMLTLSWLFPAKDWRLLMLLALGLFLVLQLLGWLIPRAPRHGEERDPGRRGSTGPPPA